MPWLGCTPNPGGQLGHWSRAAYICSSPVCRRQLLQRLYGQGGREPGGSTNWLRYQHDQCYLMGLFACTSVCSVLDESDADEVLQGMITALQADEGALAADV